jgi:signal transduction histidine kinase
MSIYRRLFLWFCAANLLTLAVSVLIAHAIFERGADRPPDLGDLVLQAQVALKHDRIDALDVPDDGRRVLIVRDGRPLGRDDLPRPVQRHLDELTDSDAEVRLPRGLWLVSRQLPASGPDTWLIVMQGPPRRAPWMRWIPVGLQILLTLIVIAGVGWVVARHLSQPLERIQAVVRRVAAGELSSRVGAPLEARDDEYGRLARDFDRMAAQIETLVQSRDQLLHDVSHELRAPLSRLRFAIELAKDDRTPETLERADREIARIDLLVGELLALARMDHAGAASASNADAGAAEEAAMPTVDLRALAEDVIEAEAPQAALRGVELRLEGDARLEAAADPESMVRALENVVRNAVRHAPSKTPVVVRIEKRGVDAVIGVVDQGPGVAPEELPRLFEPFFRGKSAQGGEGHGLGLAIVSRVLRAHRGQAEARNRETGGFEVTLRWPAGA